MAQELLEITVDITRNDAAEKTGVRFDVTQLAQLVKSNGVEAGNEQLNKMFKGLFDNISEKVKILLNK